MKLCYSLVISLYIGLTSQALATPLFQPVDIPRHIYGGGWEFFVGGGLAVFDCNDDQLPDLFAAGGENPAILLRNYSTTGSDIVFRDETPAALQQNNVIGAYPLDIDSDGIMDLVVLKVGVNVLLKGGPNCSFTPFTTLGFQSGTHWSTAFSATWEASRSLPTLAFGNYVDRNNPDGPFKACDQNYLYRADGDIYPAPTALTPGYCPLSMLFSDWGRHGRADLRVSNDRHYYVTGGQEQMWAMEDTPRLYGEQDGWQRFNIWGMGIASRDITGDGLPEVYLSSMADQKLQSLEKDASGPTFRNADFAQGTAAHRPYTGGDGRPSTGWQISFGDVDNDGLDDVFIAKGNVDQMPGSAMDDPNDLLMGDGNSHFHEAGQEAGLASVARGRGAALADFNRDGLLDVVVVNRRAPIEIYQNVTLAAGNWLDIRLHQNAPNVDAVGAWIELKSGDKLQSREITVGGGHASGVSGPEHFGIGNADTAEVRVIWPNGTVSPWTQLSANTAFMLERTAENVTVRPY